MAGRKTVLGNMTSGCAIALATSAPGVEGVTVPDTIQLLAIGKMPSRNGQPPFVIVRDRAHAEQIAAATTAHHRSNQIVVDYDHQSVFAARPGVGGQARASGWMPKVFATDQGVFAEVNWTEAAQSAIGALEYRYISPVFTHDKAGNVLCIINAALTNTPSLDLAAVASAFSTEEGSASMNFAEIAKALGLGEDATLEEILRAIAALNTAPATMTAIASALGAAEGADLVAAAAALKVKADNAGNPDPAKFVPVETVAALQTSVQSLQASLDGLQADKRKAKIDEAQAAGKLAPALVAYASSIADDATLDKFLAALPGNALGKGTAAGDPPGDKAKLSAEEIAVCTATGISQEDFLAARESETEGN